MKLAFATCAPGPSWLGTIFAVPSTVVTVDGHERARPHPERAGGGLVEVAGQRVGLARADDRAQERPDPGPVVGGGVTDLHGCHLARCGEVPPFNRVRGQRQRLPVRRGGLLGAPEPGEDVGPGRREVGVAVEGGQVVDLAQHRGEVGAGQPAARRRAVERDDGRRPRPHQRVVRRDDLRPVGVRPASAPPRAARRRRPGGRTGRGAGAATPPWRGRAPPGCARGPTGSGPGRRAGPGHPRTGPGRPTGLGEQDEPEQRPRLGLVGQEPDEHPGQPGRPPGQVGVPQVAPAEPTCPAV